MQSRESLTAARITDSERGYGAALLNVRSRLGKGERCHKVREPPIMFPSNWCADTREYLL